MAARKKATVNDRTELIEALDAIEKEKQIARTLFWRQLRIHFSLPVKISTVSQKTSG